METRFSGVRQFPAYQVSEQSFDEWRQRPTVYLDTSVPSYLTSKLSADVTTANRQLATREWWREHRERFGLLVSVRVLQEVAAGDIVYAERRVRALSGIKILDIPDACHSLAQSILKIAHLPAKASVDAEHIAIAAIYDIRFLLTWNFKHMANARTRQKVVRACELSGFRSPNICTPEDLMRIFANERPHP